MKRSVTVKVVLSACAVATASSPLLAGNEAPGARDAEIKAITENDIRWNQDLAAKDSVKIATYYAEDGVLLTSGQKPFVGRAAIQAAFAAMTSDPAFELKFHAEKVVVAKSGDFGYTQGPYTLSRTDPATKQVIHDHGNYVTTYHKQADGSWKATEDVVVSEVPPK